MDVPHSMKPMNELTTCGGAYVRRPLDFKGTARKVGSTLTADEVESIPLANRRALINTGRIELYPAAPPSSDTAPAERIILAAPGGKAHVVEGRLITDEPITKAEAQALVAEAKAA